jgi:shikimate kinase
MNLILFGFKACGKTTLGKKLAQKLERPFVDTDVLIEQLYYRQTGHFLPFREIFKKAGVSTFRQMESQVLQQLSHHHQAIIALGGGLILNQQNAAFLAKLGQLVYLKVSKETLKQRLLGKAELPAFLNPLDPEGSFEQMYRERQAKYEEIHAVSIDMENQTEDQIILELCTLIRNMEHTHG